MPFFNTLCNKLHPVYQKVSTFYAEYEYVTISRVTWSVTWLMAKIILFYVFFVFSHLISCKFIKYATEPQRLITKGKILDLVGHVVRHVQRWDPDLIFSPGPGFRIWSGSGFCPGPIIRIWSGSGFVRVRVRVRFCPGPGFFEHKNFQ